MYSSKILFTSFYLNNQTESGRRILSSCCFCLILIFLRSVRAASLDISFRPPFELHNHSGAPRAREARAWAEPYSLETLPIPGNLAIM